MQIRIHATHPKDGRSFKITMVNFPDDRAQDFARSIRSLAKAAYGPMLQQLITDKDPEARRNAFFDTLFDSICGEFHMFGSQFDFTDSMDRQPVDLFRNFLSLCASVYTAQTFGWLPTTALLQAPDIGDIIILFVGTHCIALPFGVQHPVAMVGNAKIT